MRRLLAWACLMACVVAGVVVAQGPLTPISQLRGRTDGNGALYTVSAVASGAQTPLTPIGQLRGRTDANGSLLVTVAGGTVSPDKMCLDLANQDACVQRNGAGILQVGNAATSTDFARLQFGGATASFPSLKRSGTSLVVRLADDSNDAAITAAAGNFTQVNPSGSAITAGSGTGISVADAGRVQGVTYKVTITSPAFVCAATTCDVTIGTLTANTWITNVTASVTVPFACTATCTSSTLSMMLGKGSGGAEYLASGLDVDAAAAVFGDADAEMGTLLTNAAAIQGGTFTAETQAIVMRLTSGTGNIGTGAATNLSAGTVVFWVTTLRLP